MNKTKCYHYDYLPFKEEDLKEECKYCKDNKKYALKLNSVHTQINKDK